MTPEQIRLANAVWKLQDGRPLFMQPLPWHRRLFCRHRFDHWVRNIYGDQINYFNARSAWQCSKCGGMGYSMELMKELEAEELKRLMS